MSAPVPEGVVDLLLWRDACAVLARHLPYPADPSPYPTARTCSMCGQPWPCTARETAQRGQVEAMRPWPRNSALEAAPWRR